MSLRTESGGARQNLMVRLSLPTPANSWVVQGTPSLAAFNVAQEIKAAASLGNDDKDETVNTM